MSTSSNSSSSDFIFDVAHRVRHSDVMKPISPNLTGDFGRIGLYNNVPYFAKEDGSAFLWCNPQTGIWYLSSSLGDLSSPYFYFRQDSVNPNLMNSSLIPDKGASNFAYLVTVSTEYVVEGSLLPDLTGQYVKYGIYNNRPYYKNKDGNGYLWYKGYDYWAIAAIFGDLSNPYFTMDPGETDPVASNYWGENHASGTANVFLYQFSSSSESTQSSSSSTNYSNSSHSSASSSSSSSSFDVIYRIINLINTSPISPNLKGDFEYSGLYNKVPYFSKRDKSAFLWNRLSIWYLSAKLGDLTTGYFYVYEDGAAALNLNNLIMQPEEPAINPPKITYVLGSSSSSSSSSIDSSSSSSEAEALRNTEWLIVSGGVAAGYYYSSGTCNGETYYIRTDGLFCIWSDGTNWYITSVADGCQEIGSLPTNYFMSGSFDGTYTGFGDYADTTAMCQTRNPDCYIYRGEAKGSYIAFGTHNLQAAYRRLEDGNYQIKVQNYGIWDGTTKWRWEIYSGNLGFIIYLSDYHEQTNPYDILFYSFPDSDGPSTYVVQA